MPLSNNLNTRCSGFSTAEAQQNLAQQAYAIFQQNCLNCHGPHGAFTEQLIIESAPGLIATGTVVPGNPDRSEFYKRLLGPTANGAQMPFGQPPLSPAAIATIRQWIQAGAPNWVTQHDVNFITTDTMLSVIQNHLNTLPSFDRTFARYFTMAHLYNAGEGLEALGAYQVALSKLVNSLSWGFEINNPEPIDAAKTIFYIDLRDYEWDVRGDAWTQIEQAYPYAIEFDATTQAGLLAKLRNLRQEMDCQVPYVYVDWFLANASLPPLYHDILNLPVTDRELERELNVDVARNIQTAPGRRVWRAGFNNSGVSNNNRVVERHTSRYGAYWKSYDFAGNLGAQNILTHPLSFRHDGGEIVFNLPNGLQAYYISDASGNRIDVAPTDIVSNPAASDPAVRNGLSCIGCHTEGMKDFEDGVRSAVEQTTNPAFDKAQALRLYVEKAVMDRLVEQDTARYKTALEATGGVFGGIEPVFRFYEAFQVPLNASHAASAVGWETEAFLQQIREKPSLQNLGLTGLLRDGNVQRDAWTSNFDAVVSALYRDTPSDERTPRPVPVGGVYIPDPNLRAVIEEVLGKASGATITTEDMERLTRIDAEEKGISDLTGLEHAIRLERIEFQHNSISDLSPLAGLVRMNNIKLERNKITDVSPLARLTNVDWLGLEENVITDLSPLRGLVKLNGIGIAGNPISDVSPLAGCISLEGMNARRTAISDFSPLAKLRRFQWLEIDRSNISNLLGLADLTQLTRLQLNNNSIKDISPLRKFTRLKSLELNHNTISDVSPLAGLTNLEHLHLSNNIISDVSPLAGLINLERLSLNNNAISDFSPLQGLAEKIIIDVRENPGKLLQGGPKITGPWLWMLLPGSHIDSFRSTDLLARASGGKVKELEVATNGVTKGQAIGDSVWTPHKISPTGGNNINDMLNVLGMSTGENRENVVYGLVTLNSPREQKTRIFAGSDNNHKVWLNGELITEKLNWNWNTDYQESFPVTLKQGKNVLLVAVHDGGGGWSGYFGFAPDAEYTVLPPGANFSFSANTTQLEVGDIVTLHLRGENISDLAGWQTDITFDPNVLKAGRVSEGSFLKQNGGQVHFQNGEINNTSGRINGLSAVRFSEGGVSGTGTLLSATFTAKADGETRVSLRNFRAGSSAGKTILATLSEVIILVGDRRTAIPPWDVNEDGQVNVIDLVLVANVLVTGLQNPRADVNGDGHVNVLDLITITRHFDGGAAPAVSSNFALPPDLTREMVEQALEVLRVTDDGSLTFQRAIANLEQLLALFIPEETALLHNYPNPFNPETWIPYQLAKPAEVTVHIYAANGALVRTLALGHQAAGIYQYRSRAAYWDGKNEVGESVASGIYFYTLTAGDFTATKKMLIRK